ncbi:MAG: DUF87 domain-containing protein [Candidatus Nezhaarchaeales archaeon]
MYSALNRPFEDLDGRFKARLKSSQVKERSFIAREGTVTLTSVVGVFEAAFDLDVLSHLEKPCFIAVKRTDKDGEKYLIYEVTAVKPVHYQMLSISSGMPKIVRHEYLEKVDQSWGRSEDTWIDIYAVYTGYVMREAGGGYTFERNEAIVPLEGAEAKLLSVEAVEDLINVKGGVSIGVMEGVEKELLVNLERLLKYHGGVFGFTGVGKSNLTSMLARKILENLPDVKVAVIDVAGEYGVGLADQIAEKGAIYTTENYELAEDRVDAFLASQAVPETLYEALNQAGLKNVFEAYVEDLFNREKIRPLSLELRSFEALIRPFEAIDRPEAISMSMDLRKTLEKRKLPVSISIDRILKDEQLYSEVLSILNSYKDKVKKIRYPPEKLVAQIELTIKVFEAYAKEVGEKASTPEDIAYKLTDPQDPERLIVIYVPNPLDARRLATRLIDGLFIIRKRRSRGPRLLLILDEAQEFIPDRVSREDFTAEANIAVEKLLRQGRKYRIHGWISTQRVAHLNVNAIQQIQSFFVGTLPREYDRRVIAEATGISPDILDKTAYLDVGEWLFVSFRATKLRNVPVFIRAENNEEALLRHFSNLSS